MNNSPPPSRPGSPVSNFLDVSTSSPRDNTAMTDSLGSLSASLTLDGRPAYDPQSAMAAISGCIALGDSVVSLMRQSDELDSRLSWTPPEGEDSRSGQDMVVTLQELKAMSAVNSRTLELVQKLNRQQLSYCERLYELEEQIARLGSEVGRSQSSASRLLYRTKEHVRKEREKIKDAISVKEDKHGDQVQALSVALSQVRKQETLLAEHVRRWESELITVRKTARAELDALWSSRIYAFMCRVCAFVAHLTVIITHAANVRFREAICGCYAGAHWCMGVIRTYSDLLRLLCVVFVLSVVFLEEVRKGPTEPMDNRPIWESARARVR